MKIFSGQYALLLTLLVLLISLGSCKQAKETEGSHKFTNELVHETSPYLLQHAHNPVDWKPWSEEALNEAREQDKLVLVSIGYSSCHWCHVMEEETFEDEAIAAIMNENFVNIKVDREERPDVDQVYMTALQLLKGSGGWPLNVITLPNGKPLYGGTYHTNSQWKQVITEISQLYKDDPQRAREYADKVAAGVQEVNLIKMEDRGRELNRQLIEESLVKWKPQWDRLWGGNQGNQKFMLPSNLSFLLEYATLTDSEEVEEHVRNTLDKIAMGGIYDHVGGGFYRYSTDPYWRVPHFEKMLYDNGQLIGLYAKAFKQFRDPDYKEVVYETFQFLEREMKHPGGGYYAALDADSEGEEGKFYVWGLEELDNSLGGTFNIFSEYFNIHPDRIWENEKYVLHKSLNDNEFAAKNDISIGELKELKENWRKDLLEVRNRRVRPGLDDKILTSWNALVIDGLVEAFKSFGDERFLNAAVETFEFIVNNSFDGQYLRHSFKENSRPIDGFLDDYAFMGSAALNLFEVTGEQSYLKFARKLDQTVREEFRDDTSVLFQYKRENELISKIVKINDGIMPSPNASVISNQLKLAHIYYNRAELEKVEEALALVAPAIQEDASNYTEWASLILKNTYPYYEIAVVGPDALSKSKQLQARYLPNTLVVATETKSDLALFKDRYFEDDTYIFVCQNNTCNLPTTSVDDAIGQLDLPGLQLLNSPL